MNYLEKDQNGSLGDKNRFSVQETGNSEMGHKTDLGFVGLLIHEVSKCVPPPTPHLARGGMQIPTISSSVEPRAILGRVHSLVVDQWFSKCGPQTSSMPWEFEDPNAQAPSQKR